MPGTKSQVFSQHVFDRIQGRITDHGGDVRCEPLRKYKSLCKRAGGSLRVMGLIQFLTFLEARGQREAQHHALLEDLRVSCGFLGLPTAGDSRGYLNAVRQLKLPQYMRLTREVLRLLDWHKRLADIMIEGTVDDYSEDG